MGPALTDVFLPTPKRHSMRFNKIVLSLLATFALAASADVVRYTDRASYNTATGANTLIDFEAQATESWGGQYFSSLTVGDVTFTDNAPRLFVLHAGYYGDAFTSYYLNNNSAGTQITIQFAAPVYGFALDLATIFNWGSSSTLQETFTFAGESFTVDLAGQQAYGNVALDFVGFTSTTAFSSITISDPTAGLAIDNFAFTAAPVAAELPEPASLALAGLALLGCGVARKRRSA